MDAFYGLYYRGIIKLFYEAGILCPASIFKLKMKKKYTHILWDFNGTIYNDVDASRQATNVLLEERNLKPIETIRQLREGFCFPVKDYYSSLGFDYSLESYEDIAIKWTKLYNDFSKLSTSVDGVGDVITKLNVLGYTQSIISACENDLLHTKLFELGFDGLFAEVEGTGDSNAHSKMQIALEWKRCNPSSTALFIGDTPHDFEVATAINADCILYSGGFVSEARLISCGCPVIGSFEELWSYIEQ